MKQGLSLEDLEKLKLFKTRCYKLIRDAEMIIHHGYSIPRSGLRSELALVKMQFRRALREYREQGEGIGMSHNTYLGIKHLMMQQTFERRTE